MQYLQVLFEAACFSEQFDTYFKKIGTVPAENTKSQKIVANWSIFKKKSTNIIILSHIKLILV